jgi:hypothetical protein
MAFSSMALMGCLSSPDPLEQWGTNTRATDEFNEIDRVVTPAPSGNFVSGTTNVDYIATTTGSGQANSDRILVLVQGAGACGDCYSCANNSGFTDRHGNHHAFYDTLQWDDTIDTNNGKTVITGTSFDVPLITDPNSPFSRGYSYAYFPNVTADAFTGNNPNAHYDTSTAPPGFTCQNTANVKHVGYSNFNTYLSGLKTAFPNLVNPTNPTTLVFWGFSSGGLGVLCNAQQIQNAFNNPNIKIYLFDDGGVPLVGHDNVENLAPGVSTWMDGNHWIAQCPRDDNGDGNTVGPEDTERYNRVHLAGPNMRFGSRQSTNDFVMSFFAWYLGGVDDGTGNSPYAVKQSLSFDLTRDASGVGDISTGNAYTKGFFGSADMHTIGDNKDQSPPVLETYSEGGVNFIDFVRGWMEIDGYAGSYTTMQWSNYPY